MIGNISLNAKLYFLVNRFLFDLIIASQSIIFSVVSGWVFLG